MRKPLKLDHRRPWKLLLDQITYDEFLALGWKLRSDPRTQSAYQALKAIDCLWMPTKEEEKALERVIRGWPGPSRSIST